MDTFLFAFNITLVLSFHKNKYFYVVQACNPSYSGGKDLEDHDVRLAG
jgi:hypothetical protein